MENCDLEIFLYLGMLKISYATEYRKSTLSPKSLLILAFEYFKLYKYSQPILKYTLKYDSLASCLSGDVNSL